MKRPHHFLLAIICSSLLCLGGCGKGSSASDKNEAATAKIQPIIERDAPPSLSFDLKLLQDPQRPADIQLFDCTYQAQGRTAKFRIEFKYGSIHRDIISIQTAEGRFISVAGSDNTALLQDLKTALEAKRVPATSGRVSELPFSAVVLGDKQSRSAEGSYSDNPPGDWVLAKIFLPKGGDEGEVFFHFNPILGRGEFSIKDSDYGDYLLKELTKVL